MLLSLFLVFIIVAMILTNTPLFFTPIVIVLLSLLLVLFHLIYI